MKKLILVMAVLVLLCAGVAAQAALLFDRGLPTANLNNAAGVDRSNVDWRFGVNTDYNWCAGDDFMIGTAGQSYVIDSLTVWNTWQGDVVGNIDLYIGKDGGLLAKVATGPASVVTTYANGQRYETGTVETYRNIYQTTFSGLNFLVDGGVKYDFGAAGDSAAVMLFNHASNAPLSGSTQQGADGKYLAIYTDGLVGQVWGPVDSNGDGWDKSSDINVRVNGTAVPEPMSIMLGIMGLGSVVGFRKLRK